MLPHESKVLPYFLANIDRFGDLNAPENRRRLADAIGATKPYWQVNGGAPFVLDNAESGGLLKLRQKLFRRYIWPLRTARTNIVGATSRRQTRTTLPHSPRVFQRQSSYTSFATVAMRPSRFWPGDGATTAPHYLAVETRGDRRPAPKIHSIAAPIPGSSL